MAQDDEDPDLNELARLEAKNAKAAPAKPTPQWGVAAEDQPFDDEPGDDDRYERLSDGRTAASTGARLPLRLAAAAGAVFHAIPPLATIAEKTGHGRMFWHPVDKLSPFLWERLIHARLTAGWEQIALGLLEVALCLAALQQAGTRLRVAVQLFAGAAILNAADWYFLGFDLLHNPALIDPERRGAMMFTGCELALALLLWLRVRPPSTMFSRLRGRRFW